MLGGNMKTFNELYKELGLEENFYRLQKLQLYTLIRYNIEDEEIEDKFIDELYECYLYIREEFYDNDYSLDDFVDYLYARTTELKISIKDIDLDECIKEYEECRDKEWNDD